MLTPEISYLEQSLCYLLGAQFSPNYAPVFILASGGIDFAGTIIDSKALSVLSSSNNGTDKSAQNVARQTNPSATKSLYSAMGTGYSKSGLELFYDRTPVINTWSGSVVAGCLAKRRKEHHASESVNSSLRLQMINVFQGIFSDLLGEGGELQLQDKNTPSFLQLIVISPLRGRSTFSTFSERLEHVFSHTGVNFLDGPRHLTEAVFDSRDPSSKWLIHSRYSVQE